MMRGGYIHNRVLIDPLEGAFRSCGARTVRERHIADGAIVGAVDLLIELESIRIVVEAELSARRVHLDLRKATALRADELWIVVPTVQVMRSVRRKLRALPSPPQWLDLFVLTQGQALQRVTNYLPLFAGA